MFKVFVNAWKVKDIRKKIFFVLFIVAVYRLGSHIPWPGIDLELYQQAKNGGTTSTALLFSIISGGGLATIFAMGIGPYITASIIMQLLCVAIPKLEQLQKEGEEGRKKINQCTRVVAVVLAFLQGIGMVYTYRNLFAYQNWLVYATAVVSLVAGTIFVMWLSEILTERGIGNGSSIIIFANILSNLPRATIVLYETSRNSVVHILIAVGLLALFVLVMAFVVLIQDGERRITVQYSKKMVGRQMYGGQSSFIPIKVNIAGVMSIIFAISLLQFPSIVAQFFPDNERLQAVVKMLDITNPVGTVLYIVLIFFFTFFYTSFAINPIEMAENMKKNGGFIPGIRPGKPTSDYIQRTITRLSWIGACAYALIAIMPVLFQWTYKYAIGSDISIGFGGTTLLIVTGVALEIVKQLESQLLMRHYKGFLS